MTDQECAQAVAAVAVHERQVHAAKAKVTGAKRKMAKFAGHVDSLREDVVRAEGELNIEQATLEQVRARALEVLDQGPVTIRGEQIQALAGTAGSAVEGRGGG